MIRLGSRRVKVKEGELLVEVARREGWYLPTLCYHPRLKEARGKCRLCLVQKEGVEKPMPACVTRVHDGDAFSLQPEEVRRTELDLMLRHHPDACATCRVSGSCELQDAVYHHQAHGELGKLRHEVEEPLHFCSESLETDMDKCIRCARCVEVCDEKQGLNVLAMVGRGQTQVPMVTEDLRAEQTACISCGQCSAVCPVGAITERWDADAVRELLQDSKGKTIVVQMAPSTRVSIGEEFGLSAGSISTGQLVSALRELGFDHVFDTNFSADLTIVEEGAELLERLQAGGPFPMFTSCCPGWVTMAEKLFPESLERLSTCKSPQQMLGAVAKDVWAPSMGLERKDVVVVSLMPCTAKKEEAERPEMEGDVDYVLTTREIAHLIRERKIPFAELRPEPFDDIMGGSESSGGAALFGTTGGVMEAALRTVFPDLSLKYTPVRGLEGVREATVNDVRVAVVHSARHAQALVRSMKTGKAPKYHFVEVMACEGGCLGGGGQPKSLDPEVLRKRQQGVYSLDERATMRRSSENPSVQRLYAEHLADDHELRHRLLHTTYRDRSKGVVHRRT